MLARVLSSLIGAPLLVLCVFWRGGLPFTLGIAVLSLVSVSEFYRACRKRDLRPLDWLGYGATALFLLGANAAPRPGMGRWAEATVTALVIAGLIAELARRERAPVRDLGATLLGALYGGWLFCYLILLRHQGGALLAAAGGHLTLPPSGPLSDPGGWVVLLILVPIWAGDTGAFFIGRAWGRHKLAPQISPGKTVEGAAGGFICTLAMLLLLGGLLRLEFRFSAAMGVLVGVMAPVGDLCESALKRELGVKDFGELLPGHGGVLDRFDSLLLTTPVVYYLLWLVAN